MAGATVFKVSNMLSHPNGFNIWIILNISVSLVGDNLIPKPPC